MSSVVRWTNEEIELLKTCNNLTFKELRLLFPKRTDESIYTKCVQFNIQVRKRFAKWTSDEDNVLYENCSGVKTVEEIHELIPNRTVKAIKSRISALGLTYGKEPSGEFKTDIYKVKKSRMFNYKSKYGIILNYDKDLDTYSYIQWWKWTYNEPTPNNKILPSIPQTFFEREYYLIDIIKYVLENEANIKTREDLLKVNLDFLRKYRIYFKQFFNKGLCNALRKVYPEYNLRAFEFDNVPLGYWENKDNCDEYLRYVLEEVFVISDFNNVRTELPPLLTFTHMRFLKLKGLSYSISTYRHYESMFHWIESVYPELGLCSEDFDTPLGFDGTVLNSSEEITVYNLLKRDMQLDVKSVGLNKKFRFYDEVSESTFVPDFIINHNGCQIIVEYFGLYREKYGKSKILKDYYYKTIDKIEYFSKLENYEFIYILHDEIKDLEKLENNLACKLSTIG